MILIIISLCTVLDINENHIYQMLWFESLLWKHRTKATLKGRWPVPLEFLSSASSYGPSLTGSPSSKSLASYLYADFLGSNWKICSKRVLKGKVFASRYAVNCVSSLRTGIISVNIIVTYLISIIWILDEFLLPVCEKSSMESIPFSQRAPALLNLHFVLVPWKHLKSFIMLPFLQPL